MTKYMSNMSHAFLYKLDKCDVSNRTLLDPIQFLKLALFFIRLMMKNTFNRLQTIPDWCYSTPRTSGHLLVLHIYSLNQGHFLSDKENGFLYFFSHFCCYNPLLLMLICNFNLLYFNFILMLNFLIWRS